MEIINRDHVLWDEFMGRLEGPEGCDFKMKDPNDTNTTTWRCSNKIDREFATAILKTMPNIDIEGSMKFFSDNGGFCDCEILFNVA